MMILQSDQVAVGSNEGVIVTPTDTQKSVMKLEFKAIDFLPKVVSGDRPLDPESVEESPRLQDEELSNCICEDQLVERLDAAREAGRMEAREEVEGEYKRKITEERMQVLKLAQTFQHERERYFSAVEMEVVKLALAIAARVLHREAKIDPVMLQAVVKIALERVREGSGAVLYVPITDLQMWRDLMSGNETSAVEVHGDSRLERGECVLDTRVGKVELGVKAQLEEIEQGFFDLLQQRPA